MAVVGARDEDDPLARSRCRIGERAPRSDVRFGSEVACGADDDHAQRRLGAPAELPERG